MLNISKRNGEMFQFQALPKKLNRSVNAVKLKAGRLNLGPMLENGSYVTLNQVAIALTGRQFVFILQEVVDRK